MRLASLKISGFKSFSDRTEVTFPAGITAIVGPNGCGKSNIGDALNWVLGEQSPKHLRGKQMSDVIFNGSKRRKPLGMAEVTLRFEEAEGLEGADQGQIAITRRLFRSGESDYLVNGKRSRLKDIQAILERGHVGARTYATIEQGRIEQILNAKPKERRVLIEDAAGISGYKHKRRLSELKLEATHANLLRVNDIVVEVERQIRSLKRQAGKARRYRTLREEIRTQQKIHFGLRAMALDGNLAELRDTEKRVADAEAEAAAGLGRREVTHIEQRTALDTANQSYKEGAERLHQLELAAAAAENQVRGSSEKIEECEQTALLRDSEAGRLDASRVGRQQKDEERQAEVASFIEQLAKLDQRFEVQQAALVEAERRATAASEQLEDLRRNQFDSTNRAAEQRNRRTATEEAILRNSTQADRLRQEKDSAQDDLSRLQRDAARLERERDELADRIQGLRGSVTEVEQALKTSRAELDEASKKLAQAREREKAIVGRLHALEDVATRFAGVSDGVRMLLAEGPAAGVRTHGVVADFVNAGPEIESVAEGYLGAFLPTVILQDDTDLERATRLLRDAGAGRTSLISCTRPAGAPAVGVRSNGNSDMAIPESVLADPRVDGRLHDQLELLTSLNGVLADRVGDAVVVDGLKTALELHRNYSSFDYLTRDGDVVYASGVVTTGGFKPQNQGLLAHRRRMEESRVEAAAATEVVRESQTLVDRLRGDQAALEATDRGRREELANCEHRHVELELQTRHAGDEHERTGKRDSVLSDEIAALAEEGERLSADLATSIDAVAAAEQKHAEIERRLGEHNEQLAGIEAEARRLRDVVSHLRADRAGMAERRDAMEQEARRIAAELLELEGRVEAFRKEAVIARQRGDSATELKTQTEQQLVGFLADREALERSTQEMERDIGERGRLLVAAENELRDVRGKLEQLREATGQAQLERTRVEADRAHLDEMCANELGIDAAAAAMQAGKEALDGADAEALSVTIEEIKGKIERLGPVNMTAIEEFSELEERHGFLSSQKQDLEEAMAKLRDTIRRINRASRERFTEAFEAIRSSYQEVFQVLFNGGRADLILEDEEDVLECGIEILVQPPGKRLGTVQLMSGGEKALSAIALLFAIFRFQPSPFCLLDEVDAPLDDSNVGRFMRLLGEYAKQTQFIVVTHNKLSMETANLLYGVTMEEPGVSKVMSLSME
jgi:chromosome segregation protein